MKKVFMLGLLSLMFLSCTDNTRARQFGGTEEITLQPNHKFVNSTWKENEMWIITEDTTTNIFYMKEKSSWGVLEGTVIIRQNTQSLRK